MGVPLEVRTESALQGEVLRRGSGHRPWPDEVKGRIAAETLVPWVLIRDVAAVWVEAEPCAGVAGGEAVLLGWQAGLSIRLTKEC